MIQRTTLEFSTVCEVCKGFGLVPIKCDDAEFRIEWLHSHYHEGLHDCNGWHFTMCIACNGTGSHKSAA